MSNYDHDQDPYDYDDDERFYEETVYNEEYYIEQERELIRQSNLDLEIEELEERQIREIREEGLLRPSTSSPEGAGLKPKRTHSSISQRMKFLSEYNLKSPSA
jgi:hypothetical protein